MGMESESVPPNDRVLDTAMSHQVWRLPMNEYLSRDEQPGQGSGDEVR